MEGLLPPIYETIEHQAGRVMDQLHNDCPTPLSKYELLSQLAATNNRLLYYVLINNLEELAPIVYTPTVGEACQKFDRIYRCARWELAGDLGGSTGGRGAILQAF